MEFAHACDGSLVASHGTFLVFRGEESNCRPTQCSERGEGGEGVFHVVLCLIPQIHACAQACSYAQQQYRSVQLAVS